MNWLDWIFATLIGVAVGFAIYRLPHQVSDPLRVAGLLACMWWRSRVGRPPT